MSEQIKLLSQNIPTSSNIAMDVLLLQNHEKNKMTKYSTSRKSSQSKESGIQLQKAPAERKSKMPDFAPQCHPTPELTTYGGLKLGWIQGVMIPCLLNIWGVMLFLRIAWVVGQAGMALSALIIAVSAVVCVITTLSLSAICTNGELKGGGVYYLVSRSLGAELGASVGIIFAFANSVAASMNTIGFCDSLNDLLKECGVKILDNGVNDTRIIGTVALLVMCLICAIGMDWETKTQNFLITVIVLAIFNFIIGALIGPRNDTQIAQGFVGINLETIKENMWPDFRFSEEVHHDFFSVFAIYFPAVTGVQAGANICGDLKDPATAIPKGTLLALLISMTSYLVMALLSGAGALRDASGAARDLQPAALAACAPNCSYGLHNNYQIMQLMSGWGLLNYFGCWAATLSTALTNLLSVPRLIQALGVDRIYPGLIFFSKPYGKHGEPYRGYLLTFAVSFMFLLIADLNMIAPLISNFYLASYALINFCTFHAAFIHHISWRPTFKFYNTWVSLVGVCLCTTIMVVMSWVFTLVTVGAFVVLYLLVLYRKPKADWGSSADALRYHSMVEALVALSQQHSAKAYNPQLLVMAGRPGRRPALLDLAETLTKGSYSLVADICSEKLPQAQRAARVAAGLEWMRLHKSPGFYALLDASELDVGARALMQVGGLGRLAPNILLLGYKYDWSVASKHSLLAYFRIIQTAVEHQLGVTVLRTSTERRARARLPAPELLSPPRSPAGAAPRSLLLSPPRSPAGAAPRSLLLSPPRSPAGAAPRSLLLSPPRSPAGAAPRSLLGTLGLSILNSSSEEALLGPTPAYTERGEDEQRSSLGRSVSWVDLEALATQSEVRSDSSKNSEKETDSDFLDMWWLYDDGGLNLLLPYIMAYRGSPTRRMRIYALARTECPPHEAKSQGVTNGFGDRVAGTKSIAYMFRMELMLLKLRIEYESLTMLSDVDDEPGAGAWNLFNELVSPFRWRETENNMSDSWVVSEEELARLRGKSRRHVRLRELLLRHSRAAGLVALSMPLPRAGAVSPALYMTWLEVLSRDLPPVLFVRGNGTCVLSCEA